MNLTDQVTSLELSQRLKELGVPQSSLYWWNILKSKDAKKLTKTELVPSGTEWGDDFESVAAFTSSELGEMLPDHIDTARSQFDLSCWKEEDGWRIHYGRPGMPYHEIEESNESNARASMLIFLIERGLHPYYKYKK